jgi:hypothetical protein
VAPNHAETQGARGDMKACGPWKGSGEGPLSSNRLLLNPILSRRPVFFSSLIPSRQIISPSRLCSDIINLSLPSTPHRPADPGAGRGKAWGPIFSTRLASSPLFSIPYLFISRLIASHLEIGSAPLLSHSPCSPSPAMARRELGGRIGSHQLESDHITFYLNAPLFGSTRFFSDLLISSTLFYSHPLSLS